MNGISYNLCFSYIVLIEEIQMLKDAYVMKAVPDIFSARGTFNPIPRYVGPTVYAWSHTG